MKKSNAGFTLIELLVVVGIIAILAVVGIALYSSNLKKARDTTRKEDIEAVAVALESNYQGAGYKALKAEMFVKEEVPYDPLTDADTRTTAITETDCGGNICRYCVITADPPPDIASAVCRYSETTPPIAVDQPADVPSFIICANLEAGGSFCLKGRQE